MSVVHNAAPAAILARALRTTQRAAPRQPWYVGTAEVEANVYPDGFDRVPGCLAAAVYRIPGAPDELRLVCCYGMTGRVEWTDSRVGEASNSSDIEAA